MAKITVQNKEITIVSANDSDYISLTDMANAKESESRAADIIKNWLRNKMNCATDIHLNFSEHGK